MQPTKQTVLGARGNCLSAVMASLLHLPIEEIPDFGTGGGWRQAVNAWLRPRGFAYIQIKGFSEWAKDLGIEGCYHEITGPTADGNSRLHACVGQDGAVVFDPDPEGRGLRSELYGGLFVCLRPWEMAQSQPRLGGAGSPLAS